MSWSSSSMYIASDYPDIVCYIIGSGCDAKALLKVGRSSNMADIAPQIAAWSSGSYRFIEFSCRKVASLYMHF